MVWKYIAAAVGLAAAAAIGTFYILGVSPIPAFFEGGNPRALSTSPAPIRGAASVKDYSILQKGYLLETGESVFLAKKDVPLTNGSVAYLIRCMQDSCTRQKLLQQERMTAAVASNKFDQFAFLAGPKLELYFVNVGDNVLAHGQLELQCTRRPGELPSTPTLKSIGNRAAYVEFEGEDCLTAKYRRAEFALTEIQLKQKTADTVKVVFNRNGSTANVGLEVGADAEGRRLK